MGKNIKLQPFEGYTYTDGGVCAAQGFVAGGLNCGLNPVKEKNDLGMVYSETLCDTACVYTTNKVKGAPIYVTQRNLQITGGKAKAVIVNSKNANTCNADGEEKAQKMCELAADALHIQPEEVVVASTGVIGQVLPIEPIANHVKKLAGNLTPDGHVDAATAIMTTDTVRKEVAVSFTLGGQLCHLGGMAKGSGMIHPNMATTLNFITTDAGIDSSMLQKALDEVVKITYNCLSVDGDTSTNDMVCIMANGAAGNERIIADGESFDVLKKALYIVMMNMTKMLAKDGEGATKLLECEVIGAPDWDTAVTAAKSVIRSPLVKCAMFGADANCGRILCALGYAETDLDVSGIDVCYSSGAGKILVCEKGCGLAFDEDAAKKILLEEEIRILVDLNQGAASAKAWGCDLTYDYVKINGDYRS